jgi:hypothetical protein
MIVVTGATGKLGRLVVEGLLKKVPAREIAVAVRSPEKAKDLAIRGVAIRPADYSRPETLAEAFAGAEKVLLVSSSEVGQRAPQHAAVTCRRSSTRPSSPGPACLDRTRTCSSTRISASPGGSSTTRAGTSVASSDGPRRRWRTRWPRR